MRHVVANNHHFRIAPHEARLPLQVALRYAPPSALSPWNLLGSPHAPEPRLAPFAEKVELSHHLAHAFSAIHSAPFDHGLVVVMDGMGDALHDWLRAKAEPDPLYFTEISVGDSVCSDHPDFVQFPKDLFTRPGVSFREAETAYTFRRDRQTGAIRLKRMFKRWTPETAPSELPNHSFEEMESVGAVYSRLSALLFRDWNACGKVPFVSFQFPFLSAFVYLSTSFQSVSLTFLCLSLRLNHLFLLLYTLLSCSYRLWAWLRMAENETKVKETDILCMAISMMEASA